MAHYGVARMTARNALRLLQDEGLITAEHGRGVYVRARPPVRRLASDRFAQRHRKEARPRSSPRLTRPPPTRTWT
jgi:GntR family transcriptional regulator